ncbi:MAG TPA: nucleotidyltransferase domain-containing protein [Candidatus Angelobacter sp.]|nr:nucleotidyltransferase domain-containing protein [Candidatus Angelobacter sp.]
MPTGSGHRIPKFLSCLTCRCNNLKISIRTEDRTLPEREPNPNLIVPLGTQVVLRTDVATASNDKTFVRGSVGEIVKTPADATHSYRVRLPDGCEFSIRRSQFSLLKAVKKGPVADPGQILSDHNLFDHVIYRCVVGSQAYGLSHEDSDIDRRGIYLPPAELEWSLYGVPEQLENQANEECYWEFKKFVVLALKANPNVLECLYTPLVETATEIAQELLDRREMFLSRLVYQTYNGYVMSQFKRLEQDLRAQGEIKWKHAMHLIRLLLAGIHILSHGFVPVAVGAHRDRLLEIRQGATSWNAVNAWRLELHRQFENAYQATRLPEHPNYDEANRLLIKARRSMVG